MEDNKKTFIEKFSMYMSIVSGIFGIIGFSLYSILKNSDTIVAFITKHIIMFLLVIHIVVLFIYVFVISYNKLKKQDNPPSLSVLLISFLLIGIISLAYLTFNKPEQVLADNEPQESIEHNNDSEESKLKPNEKFYNNLTPEQRQVDYYVPECKQKIFEIEFWSKFSDEELYHILNGIYAYEGMIFPGDYFDDFKWYKGYIKYEDFTEDMLCHNQHVNIANIISVLEERGLR